MGSGDATSTSSSSANGARKLIRLNSDRVTYTSDAIHAKYRYETVSVEKNGDDVVATPVSQDYELRVESKPAKLGLMLVGWGGNNGTTVTAGILANKHGLSWKTNRGEMQPNYLGSLTQMATLRLGATRTGGEVYVPFWQVLPMVHPNDLILGGWDISGMNLGDAMRRAQVMDYNLQEKVYPYMKDTVPLPSVYDADFIAANQSDRADNIITGSKKEQLDTLRSHIRDFKAANDCDSVIVLWTANTERYSDVKTGVHDTAENLLRAIDNGESEIAPSVLYAAASILEGCAFINGSPQNTLLPGVVDLATKNGVFIAGDDFKSGQTKMKSVLMDFLVSAGIKPVSIASYNHLGNNDGKNLASPQQFRSKEISKSNVVDDMVASNELMYAKDEHPDHIVVIKYVPYVGDSKRALDEYTSEIFMGGSNTIVMHNTCEDSLLASPLILDLAILCELFQRISFRTSPTEDFQPFRSVLAYLSYLLKAPKMPSGMPIINALAKQRAMIENIFRACVGLPPENHLLFEHITGHVDKLHSPKGSPKVLKPAMSESSLRAYTLS